MVSGAQFGSGKSLWNRVQLSKLRTVHEPRPKAVSRFEPIKRLLIIWANFTLCNIGIIETSEVILRISGGSTTRPSSARVHQSPINCLDQEWRILISLTSMYWVLWNSFLHERERSSDKKATLEHLLYWRIDLFQSMARTAVCGFNSFVARTQLALFQRVSLPRRLLRG